MGSAGVEARGTAVALCRLGWSPLQTYPRRAFGRRATTDRGLRQLGLKRMALGSIVPAGDFRARVKEIIRAGGSAAHHLVRQPGDELAARVPQVALASRAKIPVVHRQNGGLPHPVLGATLAAGPRGDREALG